VDGQDGRQWFNPLPANPWLSDPRAPGMFSFLLYVFLSWQFITLTLNFLFFLFISTQESPGFGTQTAQARLRTIVGIIIITHYRFIYGVGVCKRVP